MSSASSSSWIALRYPRFRAMYMGEFFVNVGSAMQLTVVGWHIWRLTGNELALGMVGLVRILPIIILALFGGVIADAVDRRHLLVITHTAALILAGLLAIASLGSAGSLTALYIITAALAGLSAFETPARAALLPTLVPPEHLAHAARMNSLMFPITAVLGPMFGGAILSLTHEQFSAVYALNAIAILPAVLVLMSLQIPSTRTGGGLRDINFNALREGLRFVWNMPALRGSMLLDFFATFFSSALALMPVYATNILHVDAFGNGLLLAAPSVGSIIGALFMTQFGGRLRRQGEIMLWAVGFYGVCTILFGLSSTFILSFIALAGTGLGDSISTMVRATMRQLLTPDALRGRMLSVNMIFFMGGPQLGEFEAGALARLTSAPFSVISGGVGGILAVIGMAVLIPGLRTYREADALRIADARTVESGPALAPAEK